jgi:hypothetical protein
MTEALGSSETSVLKRATRRKIPEEPLFTLEVLLIDSCFLECVFISLSTEVLFAVLREVYPRYEVRRAKSLVALKMEAICFSETSVLSGDTCYKCTSEGRRIMTQNRWNVRAFPTDGDIICRERMFRYNCASRRGTHLGTEKSSVQPPGTLHMAISSTELSSQALWSKELQNQCKRYSATFIKIFNEISITICIYIYIYILIPGLENWD